MPRTHNLRSVNLCNSEVYCGYCGGLLERRGAKFCSWPCYNEKRKAQPTEQLFWSKVDRSGECWLWTASRFDTGYGQFKVTIGPRKQRSVGAHVFAYELTHGPVPAGLEVMHSCDVRHCVRPDHLSAGTHADNVRDASRKGRLRTPRPTKQKLTATQIQEIRSLVASGERRFRVALYFGITKSYVTRIMSGVARPYDAPLEQVN